MMPLHYDKGEGGHLPRLYGFVPLSAHHLVVRVHGGRGERVLVHLPKFNLSETRFGMVSLEGFMGLGFLGFGV